MRQRYFTVNFKPAICEFPYRHILSIYSFIDIYNRVLFLQNNKYLTLHISISWGFFTDFIKYKSECDPEASVIRLSGILSLHLLSGRGLRTGGRSRRIRDLYCVVEVDHIHKARTVVRSGGVNFDWDEK